MSQNSKTILKEKYKMCSCYFQETLKLKLLKIKNIWSPDQVFKCTDCTWNNNTLSMHLNYFYQTIKTLILKPGLLFAKRKPVDISGCVSQTKLA